MSAREDETAPSLGAAERATLAALADVLIPAAGDLPSGSQAGVATGWLDEVLRLRPDFGPPLAAVLDRLAAVGPAVGIADLQASDPDGFFVLTEVVAGSYFLNPDVRLAIGYPGQQSVPIAPEAPPDYEQDGLLASVIARGPIYRPTPEVQR